MSVLPTHEKPSPSNRTLLSYRFPPYILSALALYLLLLLHIHLGLELLQPGSTSLDFITHTKVWTTILPTEPKRLFRLRVDAPGESVDGQWVGLGEGERWRVLEVGNGAEAAVEGWMQRGRREGIVMVGDEGDMLWLADTGMLPQWKVLSGRIEGAGKTDVAPNAPGTLPWNAWIVKRAGGKDWLATVYEPINGSAGWWFACRSSEDSDAAWVLMIGERVWRERSPLCSEAFGLEMVYV